MRQCEIKNPELRDKIAGARAVIKKNQPFLLSSTKVYVNHPDMAVAKKIYDNVLDELNEALDNIKNAAEGKLSKEHVKPVDRPGQLVDALEKFDVNTYLRSSPTHEYLEKDKPNLQEQLDDIVAQVVYIGDSSGTRINRRNQMIEGCEAQPDNLNNAIEDISKKTWDLRDNIRKAVVDNISDSFLDTGVPLFDMIIAAENGDEDKFNDASIAFEKHAVKLIEVGHLACCMSENIDGIKMVNCCIEQISKLYPKVIDAAKILVVHSNSIPAKENMQVFHKAWEKQVKILIDAVDDITTIDDFLGVTEAHILEDINNCVIALQKNDRLAFVLSSDAILNRSRRVSNVVNGHVTQEMYQPSIYKKRILDAVVVLQDKIMPKFLRGVKLALDNITADKIRSQDDKKKDEDLFIDSSNIVYNGVHEIRRALLMNKLDDDDDIDLNNSESNENNLIDEYPNIGCIKNARDVMKIMNDKDKEKIIKEVEFFKNEKIKFDKEVEKWDDSGNDIILLAKKMCIIMMEMIDFTRGCGPLKTTMDIINAAKKISVNGTKLNELISQIIENCPESTTKNDLLGYIQRIYFHCHQMNITSKVKADVVQSINGELFVSGLDSATSLIQSSKNLMNAVVHTVKASYIASTKYPRTDTNTPIVVWKMKAPEKKPLVRRETSSKKNIIRRESQKMEQSPIKVLSDFQSLDERSLF
ncbi:catenin alpha-like [Aphidius gifuensis]|uniref:catenin alpha-like n=1 Tax=Aphidius gifuensis TaxID=684658 RepID=UPI001CDBC1EA|nr:catenin alpha-like [Aphidius gifuensis]